MGGGADQGPLGTTVGTSEIEALAVTTPKIAANAVDASKLSTDLLGSDIQFPNTSYVHSDSVFTEPTTVTTSAAAGTKTNVSTHTTQVAFFSETGADSLAYDGDMTTGWIGKVITGGAVGEERYDFGASAARYVRAKITYYGDNGDETGTLYFDYSVDGSAWTNYAQVSGVFPVSASAATFIDDYTTQITCRYVRVRLQHTGASSYVNVKVWEIHSSDKAEGQIVQDLTDSLTTTKLTTTSAIGSWIKGDYGSTSEICGVALYIGAGLTATEMKAEVSADDSTYYQMRTTLLTKFTVGAWQYWFWNRPVVAVRYVKITAVDATAKVLEFYRMKGLTLTESQINRRNSRKPVSSTNNALDLEGDA